MEQDLHLIETGKSIKDIKKILKKEVFGNYNTKTLPKDKPEFGVFLYPFDKNRLVLKLDYTFMNYEDVSLALLQALGKELKCRYWTVGLVVEYAEAFIRFYNYNKEKDEMEKVDEMKSEDGTLLTPQAQEKWGFNSRELWISMTENVNWERMRQIIVVGTARTVDNLKAAWIDKGRSMKDLDKVICDTTYFYARKEIEEYRPKKIEVTLKKLGTKIIEYDEEGKSLPTRTVLAENEGKGNN